MSVRKPLILKTALATVVIASLSAVAVASHHGAPAIDVNQDKQISQSEFLNGAAARFDRIDTNNDNVIEKSERRAHRKLRREKKGDRIFAKIDANGDGVITKEEFDAKRSAKKEKRKAKRLERFDTDGDGQISETERAAKKAMRKEMKKERREGKGFKGKRPNPDANGDGVVSRQEHMDMAVAMFERLDANGDGVLTKGEGPQRGFKGRGLKKMDLDKSK